MMKKSVAASSPDAYVSALRGWKRSLVEDLRSWIIASAALDEVIKWRNLVYFSHGPLLMIRAEEERVLFGFWRGQRLASIEKRLKPGGKYEMATIELRSGMSIDRKIVKKLVVEAVKLNESLGDPTKGN